MLPKQIDLGTSALNQGHIFREKRKWEEEDQDQRSQEQAHPTGDYGVGVLPEMAQKRHVAVLASEQVL